MTSARRWHPGTTIAAVVALAVLLLALLGPLIAPYTATERVGLPYTAPTTAHPLGTDQLGRDVLSRVLIGGLTIVLTSLVTCVIATVLGAGIGITAALAGARHPRWEGILVRPLDALAAIPPLVTLLLVLVTLPSRAGVVIAGVVAGIPLAARIALATTKPMLSRGHVEVARARGESMAWIAGREIAPLAAAPILADTGLRFVSAFYLVTAAGFLGIDLGSTDWGSLVVEALPGASLQPAALVVPLLLIAALTVSVNLVMDRVVHRADRLLG